MKRFFLKKTIILSLCLFLCSPVSICFASSEGYIDVKVNAPKEFTHSIMINLLNNQGINYVVTAEKVNEWKANNALPAGDYKVDYVSFDVMDNSYEIEYPSSLVIKENSGSAFQITIKDETDKRPTGENSIVSNATENLEGEKFSFGLSFLNLLKDIALENFITLVLILLLIIYMIKRKRRKSDG